MFPFFLSIFPSKKEPTLFFLLLFCFIETCLSFELALALQETQQNVYPNHLPRPIRVCEQQIVL